LGAVDLPVLREVIEYIDHRRPVSATIGDQPLLPGPIVDAVRDRAALGTDFLKLGLFPDGDLEGTLSALAPQIQQGSALIAVLFADLNPDVRVLPQLARAGFTGVMLDR